MPQSRLEEGSREAQGEGPSRSLLSTLLPRYVGREAGIPKDSTRVLVLPPPRAPLPKEDRGSKHTCRSVGDRPPSLPALLPASSQEHG